MAGPMQDAARLLRDRALDALKAAAVAQAEAARLRAQLMLSHPVHSSAQATGQVGCSLCCVCDILKPLSCPPASSL